MDLYLLSSALLIIGWHISLLNGDWSPGGESVDNREFLSCEDSNLLPKHTASKLGIVYSVSG